MNNDAMSGVLFQQQVQHHQQITDTIRRFAEDRSLRFDAYYHDATRWILCEPDIAEGITTTMQVIAYLRSAVIWISFVPSIKVFSHGTMKIPSATRAVTRPLSRYLPAGSFSSDLLEISLEGVWAEAEQIRRNPDSFHLVEVPLSTLADKPKHPQNC